MTDYLPPVAPQKGETPAEPPAEGSFGQLLMFWFYTIMMIAWLTAVTIIFWNAGVVGIVEACGGHVEPIGLLTSLGVAILPYAILRLKVAARAGT